MFCVAGIFSTLLDHENLVSHMNKDLECFLSSLLNVYRASELLFLGRGQPQNLKADSIRILLKKGISEGNASITTNLRKEVRIQS